MTKRQWNKLTPGVRIIGPTGAPRQVLAVESDGLRVQLFNTQHVVSWDRLEAEWHLDPAEFAHSYRRDDLGKAGFFSIDAPAKRRQIEERNAEEDRRKGAYAVLGLDRDKVLARVAGVIDSRIAANGGGIWARSTGEYLKKREALDNAILYATGVRDHA